MNKWSWEQAVMQSDLKATTKHLLLTIGSFMNVHHTKCWPSISTLASLCSLTERAVFKHIQIAVAAGYLIKEKRNGQGREWDGNEYHTSLPCVMQLGEVSTANDREMAVLDRKKKDDRAKKQGMNHVHPSNNQGMNHIHPSSRRGMNDVQVRDEPRSGELNIEVINKLASYENSDENFSEADCEQLAAQEKEAEAVAEEFYTIRAELFGKPVPDTPQSDITMAMGYLALQGCDRNFLVTLFRSKMTLMKTKGQTPPWHLGYFEQVISEELAKRPSRKKSLSDEEKAETAERHLRILHRIVKRNGKDFRAIHFTDKDYAAYETLKALHPEIFNKIEAEGI